MRWAVFTYRRGVTVALIVLSMCVMSGCIQHRVAISPPLPANPLPAGEDTTTTTALIAGSRFQDEPHHPETFASSLPLDIPVSVYRRSQGELSRGEFRVKTALPWWQRFPVDAFVDLYPVTANIDAAEMVTLTPIESVDRTLLLKQAVDDGYARPTEPAKLKP